MSKLMYSSLILVSNNIHKLKEYRRLLSMKDLEMLDIPTVDPQSMNMETLVRNKIEMVRPMLRNTPFFVEHTGLIIDAWNGLPGGLTKLFMDTVGCPGICKMLQAYEESERSARAKTVIGYYHNKNIQIFEGTAYGTVSPEPRGKTAWDWDHIFIPEGYRQTYAEMGQEEKNRISMRQKAAKDFARYLSHHFKSIDEHDDRLESAGEDITRLIRYHRRRLQKLKEQQALYGISTEPRIAIEIEDIEEKITKLQAELDAIG